MVNIKKREDFKTIIIELSKQVNMSEDYCENILKRLEEIYSNNFRHFYSDITSLLLDMNSERKDSSSMHSIDQLGENVRTLTEFANEQNFYYLKEITKLNDHITMDLSRIKEWNKLIEQNKFSYESMRETNQKMNELNIKMEKTTKDMNLARSKINVASRESRNTKKDLVSIMAIFIAVFSFIQWNFSQFKDLLEYDPFNRVIYVLSIDGILILSLYCIFAMVDFIIHKDPRMLKPFLNTSTKRPTWFGIILLITSILIVAGCLYFLRLDNSRKTISKIENKIEKIELEQEYLNINLDKNKIFNKKLEDEINTKQKEIETLKKSIKKLEDEIKKLNQE